MSITQIKKDLRSLIDKKKVRDHQRFFKTGEGEYGEGDIFLGVSTPNKRKTAKKYSDISLLEAEKLLQSRYHDERQVVLFILIEQMQKHFRKHHHKTYLNVKMSCNTKCKHIYDLYVRNVKHVNNWDLVDISAHKIVGTYLQDKDRGLLYKFAKSKNLWKRRIAVISTFWYIKDEDYKDTLKISEILLYDKHDLIHKAVGWALREVGKKDFETEDKFLKRYYKNMPRTMLRYAIERFPEDLRQKYLKGEI